MEHKPCLTLKELAVKYGMSDKQFGRTLRRHGLSFKRARLLTPKEVAQIIDALGHWEETHEKPIH